MPQRGRTSGYFREDLETMPWPEKRAYLDEKLREIVRYAYEHARAFRGNLDSVGLKPDDIETIEDLKKVPITKKADLVEFQKIVPGVNVFFPCRPIVIGTDYVRPDLFRYLFVPDGPPSFSIRISVWRNTARD